ncbi:MAG: hypothetical protein JXB50_11595 [Spirochaetes bacterium]|nr:hypothetical protein [Spirochaetota bacterium]
MLKKINIDLLNNIDSLFKDFYVWLKGLYDEESGGFYYAQSSKTDPKFKPDIESTAQAIHIIEDSGLLKKMPKLMKRKLVSFFHARQDNETGFFYDPHNEMDKVDRMVARATSYGIKSLQRFNKKPLYPIPGSKGKDSLPNNINSKENLLIWLENRDWSYSWMACDNIAAARIYFKHLPRKERKEYLNIIWDFLKNKQDEETGMWGEGRPYVKISGAFKLAGLYSFFNKKMPNADKIYKSILFALRNDISEDMCWTRNPIDLLMSIKSQLCKISREEINEIIEITYNNLKVYLKEDGGFSRHRYNSLAVPNNVELGKGLKEGDMNAGTQALRIRNFCYSLAGKRVKKLKQYIGDFYTNFRYKNEYWT